MSGVCAGKGEGWVISEFSLFSGVIHGLVDSCFHVPVRFFLCWQNALRSSQAKVTGLKK